MNKKKSVIFTLTVGILILCLAGWIWVQQTSSSSRIYGCDAANTCDKQTTSQENEDWSVSLHMEQALQYLKEQKEGVYYFGYDDCPWCQDAEPVLKKVAQTHHQKVYAIKIRDEDHKLLYDEAQKKEIISYFGKYMQKNEEGELTLYVPMVVQMKEGQVQNIHIGTLDSYDPKQREMTESEVQKLQDIYEEFFTE